MAIELNLRDEITWTIEDLRSLTTAAQKEVERRQTIATAPDAIAAETARYQQALGIDVDRSPAVGPAPAWHLPSSFLDAYIGQGIKVSHGGKVWSSNAPINMWEPGVRGWSEVSATPPTSGTASPWVRPTRLLDAYARDAVVSFGGFVWKSLRGLNMSEPSVSVPLLWVKIG